jgi:chemotaxis protein histidine kinase CheA
VVGADEDDAQIIAAQATTVGAAGMQGITRQNTLLRAGEAETQSIAQPVAGVNAAGIDDVRTMMQQILQSVGVTQQAVGEIQKQQKEQQQQLQETKELLQKQQKEQQQQLQETKELLRKALAAQEQHVQSSNDEQKVLRSKLFIVTDGLGKMEENLHVLAQQTTSEQARARAQEQKLQEEMEKLRGNEMQQLHKDLQALRHELQKCRGNEERLQQSCEDVQAQAQEQLQRLHELEKLRSNEEAELVRLTADRLLAFEHELQKLRGNEEPPRLLKEAETIQDELLGKYNVLWRTYSTEACAMEHVQAQLQAHEQQLKKLHEQEKVRSRDQGCGRAEQQQQLQETLAICERKLQEALAKLKGGESRVMSTLEQERAREGQLRRKVEELTRMIEMMCNEQAKLKEATRHLQEAEDQRAGERVKGEEQASATVKAQDRRVASTTPGASTTSALDTPLRYPFTTEAGGRVTFTTEAGGRVTCNERAHVDTVKTQDRVLEFTALGATTAAAADTRSPTTAVALDTPVCMTKGNATANTPLKGGARLANVSTTSDEFVNVSTTSDDSVKRKIRHYVYYTRGGDLARKEKLEMLQWQCARGESVLIFVATESEAYLLEDVLLSIQFDVLSIAGSIKGNRGQSERGQALKIFRDGHHPGPKVLIATDESVGSSEDIPTVDIVVSYDMPDTIDEYERRIWRARNNGMATSFFTPEDAHLARDLERTLINAQQEVPRFLKEMRVARFSYQEGDHVVSLIDFHGVRKGDVGLVLGPCCDKKKVDWAERMQVSFGKGRQTEKCDYVRWHMRMADEHEVGAWEHVYVYDQRNSKELRGGRRYVAEGDTALWFRSGRH